MKRASNWIGFVLLAAVVALSMGCSDSGGGSNSTTLTLGKTTSDSIKADQTNSYKFKTSSSGAYSIFYDTVSSGDAQTLEIRISETIVCTYFEDSATCYIQDDLDADTKYDFDLVELAGQDTTFRIYFAITN